MAVIKILFRAKFARERERGSIKAFTNVRVPERRKPKQLHLGYIPSSLPALRPFDQERLTAKLKVEWTRLFDNDDVQIDWQDAERKWQRRNEPRRQWKVDRAAALADLRTWLVDKPFASAYLSIHRELVLKLPRFDAAEIAMWWDFEAALRLFRCYQRFAQRNGMQPCPNGFLDYLRGNIRRGYAKKDFLRAKEFPSTGTMPRDFFDPTPEQQNVFLIDAATLQKAQRMIAGCEACSEDAEIAFDNILDRLRGSDPSVTDYVLEVPATCLQCGATITERSLVEMEEPD